MSDPTPKRPKGRPRLVDEAERKIPVTLSLTAHAATWLRSEDNGRKIRELIERRSRAGAIEKD